MEEEPLPLLTELELRRVRQTGQAVLMAGPEDPLMRESDPLDRLGWIESFPIQPRGPVDAGRTWGLAPLWRLTHPARWQHAYASGGERPPGAVCLGDLLPIPRPGFHPLHRTPTHRCASEMLPDYGPVWRPVDAARWIGAPLGWREVGRDVAARAAASRARHLAQSGARRLTEPVPASGSELLGWLRREPRSGWSPLFCAEHPAIPDQFLTRSELEARDLGYRVIGVLGYVNDAGADRTLGSQPPEILWGSRFGRSRRFIEGVVSGSS